ncbi:MAG: hypothetical protein A2725_03120 [Candidatus Magasanikbacteria bacterium RIFCSPHIGHO2_01_FULL_33_34]|uniref:Methyltransferase type 11 domain-containing protein n=1 Tax=Candidatus Magasanikbacteria bacterium RIFCSPHIGHO2_01_FULL_33_34 TaxID=1798671 RepID=A0A1F6LHB4_9BACT|nr:MAG: hypothetical protein A2725_03120 [Candidatus Magasanikbacteria bacterium RIFCSPHIGHO2_01_FULL_33_34]OGH66122.1 MAG: hypothetical protein A3B83_00610 [Candidatus Magasanikbacteria bacterium RIFCSPHIGHO2_02_FULL_33_17]OGH75968.1 MAG: hypothetical protein A3A89_00520 [Candidatus Magasanikbacteria bacterium RIFCSPLOWO2_01_FULL_33_34]OGH82453.1 MAG: hypothetical protein A3F93_04435 [Candidatus Magasanikbacteria bacterium RIFCSPLOWO2_12_FULL_34_7]
MNLINLLKKIPLDLGQGNLRTTTKGKLIALNLISDGHNKTAIDIGCREGAQSKWLENKGYTVTSVDIEKVYEKCIIVDVNKPLPYQTESFDLIWCSEVIEHLDNPEFTTNEFRRILKPSGSMILTTPNSYFWLQILMSMFGLTPQKVQRDDHKFFFDIHDIKKLFPKAKLFGFFPYFILKFTITSLPFIGFLSPTFVIHEIKEQNN